MRRLGIFSRWETEPELLAQVDNIWSAWIDGKWLSDRSNLEEYARGEDPYPDTLSLGESRKLFTRVRTSIMGCSQYECACALRAMFDSDSPSDWAPLLAKCWTYEYWATRIDHYNLVDSNHTDHGVSLNQAVETLSICLCAGWIDQARLLTEEIRMLYERQRFFDAKYYPLYHWLLRICFDHWNLQFDAWGRSDEEKPDSLSESVLNELFDHWCDGDLLPMRDQILWLCDYYTHRTRRKDWYEFSNSHLLTRFPAVILAWQRLREIRGLENPIIGHLLMQPAYARLRPAMPFYTDTVLESLT